jgi:polysaccharide export outer membrane protein
MTSRNGFIGLLASICLGIGCASVICAGADGRNASTPSAGGTDAPATNPGLSAPTDSARALSPNDGISVTVYQEEELATRCIIDKNGMVMLPLLGQVKISGMTVAEAKELIRKLYDKDYLVNPQINLIVEHFAERRFSVLGEVQKAGNYDFPQNESVNLLEAIAMAGGYTRLGAPSKVDVDRVENGIPKKYHVDAGELAKNPKKKPFEILPNDVIYVGQRTF